MRMVHLSVAIAFAAAAVPARADVASDIRRLEAAWGAAFLANDYRTVESIVAPEYKLMRVEDGRAQFTDRADWLANSKRLAFHEFEADVKDVVVTGNTAVATVEGRWKISRADRGTRDERFILSDTWVKRNGRWQVVFRHSSPMPH
jgi:ketosteroid isomerase-like protein